MDNPTSVLGKAQRRIGAVRKARAVVTAARRCVCVLALILLFLAVGVASVPGRGSTTWESVPLNLIPLDHGLTLETWVDTLANADQEGIEKSSSYGDVLSPRARFETH